MLCAVRPFVEINKTLENLVIDCLKTLHRLTRVLILLYFNKLEQWPSQMRGYHLKLVESIQ
jgi:tRNA (Thr-GGU) A37 N-methylase